MKKTRFIIGAAMIAFASLSLSSCTSAKKDKEDGQEQEQVKSEIYQCPMDCEKGETYDEPGQCPVCEMDLEETT